MSGFTNFVPQNNIYYEKQCVFYNSYYVCCGKSENFISPNLQFHLAPSQLDTCLLQKRENTFAWNSNKFISEDSAKCSWIPGEYIINCIALLILFNSYWHCVLFICASISWIGDTCFCSFTNFTSFDHFTSTVRTYFLWKYFSISPAFHHVWSASEFLEKVEEKY